MVEDDADYGDSPQGVSHFDAAVLEALGFVHIAGIVTGKYTLKRTEEEIERSPAGRDVLGVAYGAVVGVLDGAVALDVAYGAVVGILDGAVGLDVADGAVVGVLHSAVVFQMADGAVIGVLDGAVAFDVAYGAVRLVLDGAVRFDVGDRLVVGIGDGLSAAGDGGEQQASEQQKFKES